MQVKIKEQPTILVVECYRRTSKLARDESRLGRTELLELLRRLARCSPGFDGCKPEDLANIFRMSVSDTTPLKRPERWAPGNEAAGTEVNTAPGTGDCGFELDPGGTITVGARRGVAGAEGEGDADSTIHIR
jgi:hypothetical protein